MVAQTSNNIILVCFSCCCFMVIEWRQWILAFFCFFDNLLIFFNFFLLHASFLCCQYFFSYLFSVSTLSLFWCGNECFEGKDKVGVIYLYICILMRNLLWTGGQHVKGSDKALTWSKNQRKREWGETVNEDANHIYLLNYFSEWLYF